MKDAAEGINELLNNRAKLQAMLDNKRAKFLTALRAKAHTMTQAEIAEQVGRTQGYVSQVLSGYAQLNLNRMLEWCVALGLDCDL